MSGFGGNAILFLVDGERLAGETMDNVDYNRLNLDNVGQVEIVKGASSALYGVNAVGGVINLISKEDKRPGMLISIHATVRLETNGSRWLCKPQRGESILQHLCATFDCGDCKTHGCFRYGIKNP